MLHFYLTSFCSDITNFPKITKFFGVSARSNKNCLGSHKFAKPICVRSKIRRTRQLWRKLFCALQKPKKFTAQERVQNRVGQNPTIASVLNSILRWWIHNFAWMTREKECWNEGFVHTKQGRKRWYSIAESDQKYRYLTIMFDASLVTKTYRASLLREGVSCGEQLCHCLKENGTTLKGAYKPKIVRSFALTKKLL